MSNAELFIEAVDTAIQLGYALAGWVIFFATVASILVLAAIATGAWTVRLVWRTATGPAWARGRTQARQYARSKRTSIDPDPDDDEDDDLHCQLAGSPT